MHLQISKKLNPQRAKKNYISRIIGWPNDPVMGISFLDRGDPPPCPPPPPPRNLFPFCIFGFGSLSAIICHWPAIEKLSRPDHCPTETAIATNLFADFLLPPASCLLDLPRNWQHPHTPLLQLTKAEKPQKKYKRLQGKGVYETSLYPGLRYFHLKIIIIIL